jgi:aminoglycoside phosphotransferase (APT) family kinase protein
MTVRPSKGPRRVQKHRVCSALSDERGWPKVKKKLQPLYEPTNIKVVVEAVISATLVGALLRTQFPAWASLPVRPVELDGWDNRTFRLGEEMSVRLPSGDAYSAQVHREHRWLPLLADELSLPIPELLALGEPSDLFPRPWSVRRWLPGDPVTEERVEDFPTLARDLARFLVELQGVQADGGPLPGHDNFFRGGPLRVYEAEARDAIARLGGAIDSGRAKWTLDAAVEAGWGRPPVWVHGDMTPSNLLAVTGALSGVIDFGCCAIGDPACDMVIAWTTFTDKSREVFRSETGLDEGTWARVRGWALWTGLVTLVGEDTYSEGARTRFGWPRPVAQVVDQVLSDGT